MSDLLGLTAEDREMNFEKMDKDLMLKTLREQKQQLEGIRNAFAKAPVGIYLIQDKKFVWSNEKFQEITGYSETELLSIPPADIVHHEDRMHVLNQSVPMLKGKHKEPYHFRVVDKAGDIHWITESVASIIFKGKAAILGTFLDISESESLRTSFRNSPIGIYILMNRKFVYANARFCSISGYSEAELQKMPPENIVYPEDRKMVREESISMLKGIRKTPYQFRALGRDGRLQWIMETVSSIRYRGKRAIQGNFMDITPQKEIENALRESEKKYRSLFELAREGIVIVRFDDGLILDANQEFFRQTGYDITYLKNRKIWEIQPVEFQAEAKRSFFRFGESGGGIVSWKLCQGREGRLMPVEIAAQRMEMDGVEVIFCMVRDTSERESMIRALSRASEEWRQSFDAIHDAVLLINPDFNIHRANVAAARLLDMDERHIIGKKCYTLFHGREIPPDYCPHIQTRRTGKAGEAESDEPHLGRTLQFSSFPMQNDDGEVVRSVEIISDVSRRRKQERESARLSRILADSFKGITESLSDLAESRDPYTAGHSKHVARLSLLVGRELGLEEDHLQGLQVCAILHDIGKVIIPAAILNKPGILSEHEWGLIREHPATAYEALRHIPFPWPVADVVYQHHERLDGSGYPQGLKGNEIHFWAQIIAVADLVDAITSHRPYRPRLPRQNALNELMKGRGNLYDASIVDALIRSMRIDDKRVLVVDDDPDLLEQLLLVLKEDGLEVCGYLSPEEALKVFCQKPLPLVITELNLIDMDGAELIRKMKAVHPEVEVIVTTKYGAKEETLRAMRAGASDFLEKPLDLEFLRKSVNRALQRFAGKRS